MDHDKPREFWLEELQKNKWYVPHLTPSICDGMTSSPIIHVIEYSAYDVLEKEYRKYIRDVYKQTLETEKELQRERATNRTLVDMIGTLKIHSVMVHACLRCEEIIDQALLQSSGLFHGSLAAADPTLWCNACGARTKSECKCGPIAENE